MAESKFPDVNDPGFRNVSWDELVSTYYQATQALIEGGADLILIEGYKREAHPKIEVRSDHSRPIARDDPSVVAIASDQRPQEDHLPWFRRDDIAAIADFIVARR